MRKITENELHEILRKHELWINGEGGERANLRGTDLIGADLTGANLRGANLTGANLTGAYLSESNLREANLTGANLTGAYLSESNLRGANLAGANLGESNLRRAYLRGANLTGANLGGAYLSESNLRRAYLTGANLTGAYLSESNLRGANLRGADLRGANLTGADLTGADLTGAKNIPYIPLACPEEGSFIGFKKAYIGPFGHEAVIVKLLVLEDAKRSSATGRKCRCSKAKVLDIQDIFGNTVEVVAYSKFNNTFEYKIGETVEVNDFDENRFNECAPGIHFFINRQDAVCY